MIQSRTKIAPHFTHNAAEVEYCALTPHLPHNVSHLRERRVLSGLPETLAEFCAIWEEEIAPARAKRCINPSSGAMTACNLARDCALRRLRGADVGAIARGIFTLSPYCVAKSLGARFLVARKVAGLSLDGLSVDGLVAVGLVAVGWSETADFLIAVFLEATAIISGFD